MLRKPDRLRKEIALVVASELLPGDREGRARYATGEQIYTAIRSAVDGAHIGFEDVPFWPVRAKRVAGVPIQLDGSDALETSAFEADRLTTCSCADFENC